MIYHVSTGLYILSQDETVHDVAKNVYGDKSMYHVLLKANPHLQWVAGDIVEVPNKKGRIGIPEEGETTAAFISRMFSGHMVHQYLPKYLLWNSRLLAEELAGTQVFIPE